MVIIHTIYPGEAFKVEQTLRENNIWFQKDIGGPGDLSYSTRNVTKLSVKIEDEPIAKQILRDM